MHVHIHEYPLAVLRTFDHHSFVVVPTMKRVLKAERGMLKRMPRADVQRRYNIGAATDWNDMLAAFCHDNTGLVFVPEHDSEASPLSCPQCGHRLPETCMGCGKHLDPAEGEFIMTEAQHRLHREHCRSYNRQRLEHMATHHPPPPPTPAPTPPTPATPAPPPTENDCSSSPVARPHVSVSCDYCRSLPVHAWAKGYVSCMRCGRRF